MGVIKIILSLFFFVIVVGLLTVYWFMPFSPVQFISKSPVNPNFNLNSSLLSKMQFYPNMRYPSENISYDIDTKICTLQKRDNIKRALENMENLTMLQFYPVSSNPEISITCNEKVVINKDFFVAGEGGPVNVTKSGDFNIITHGKVLLLRNSNCPNPGIATHELLHALGFVHSKNPDNIMYYKITGCYQTVGKDIPTLINQLYSIQSLPDLAFVNASATMHGRYLDFNVSIVNNGFQDSEESKLIIYTNNNKIKEVLLNPINIGAGISFTFKNILIPNIINNINEVKFDITSNFSELEKNNNEIKLEMKK